MPSKQPRKGNSNIMRAEARSSGIGKRRSDLVALDLAHRKELAKRGLSPTSAEYATARRNQDQALVKYAANKKAAVDNRKRPNNATKSSGRKQPRSGKY